jgi:hypothetical protein
MRTVCNKRGKKRFGNKRSGEKKIRNEKIGNRREIDKTEEKFA